MATELTIQGVGSGGDRGVLMKKLDRILANQIFLIENLESLTQTRNPFGPTEPSLHSLGVIKSTRDVLMTDET